MAKANLFYAQSGGVPAGINASACGVIQTARTHGDKIGKSTQDSMALLVLSERSSLTPAKRLTAPSQHCAIHLQGPLVRADTN
jgi:hypothetical protein